MEKLSGLSHLFMTIFLHHFSTFMVIPAITDVTMSALCPGRDECSLAIYLTGFQQAADNVPENRRASTFGILTGIASSAFVCGNLSTRFLSTSSTFQVSALVAIAALVYMRFFLQDSIIDEQLSTPILTNKGDGKGKGKANAACCAREIPSKNVQVFKSAPSLEDMLCLLKSSVTLSQAAVVAFFYSLAEVGLHASLMYYLKAQFHFSKDQFADLMVISGIAGTVSQLVIMPLLTPALGEARLLAVGLFFTCVHVFLYSIAWTFWVPYVASMFSLLFVFSQPCMRSIVSKQVGSYEQGKAQGCISGISSFANVISPLVFSPLTALFLSERAPFPFPGFSIMCVGFASMIAFIQSLMMRTAPPIANQKVVNANYVDA
ncbi:PREDICTED: uncharacterized protein LOC105132907 isoform X3 [Populus euphratica]|uniref:Uncharacterized protein LOC105132907 isoform X3 n=1 Tax=Populus euphratica TaxID=75702 RepID=A0AAJ6URU9_POPEU|nr:PREDICTED: uncharacterized protein LOC105132907 isoform X3 [Populus euphratica]